MIILPPEEKKSSPILKWIFRLLLIFVVFLGLVLFALNILSGTSDAHRQGLERAFSDIFRVPVTIGKLTTFNIFPKFTIEMEDIRGNYGAIGGEMRAERVVLVFRFFDILFGRDLIENFQILNLTATPNIIGAHGVNIHMAGIAPTTSDHEALFVWVGEYGGLPIRGGLQLQEVAGVQPVYKISNNMPADFQFGKFGAQGKFSQTEKGEPSLHDAEFLLEDKVFATGTFTLKTSQSGLGIEADIKTPTSQLKISTIPGEHREVWNFDNLDLGDVIGEQAVWSKVVNAFSELAPAVTTPGTGQLTKVSVSIKSLSGAVTAKDIKGHFISTPTQFSGWWDGLLIAHAQSSPLLQDGVIRCGLLSLKPIGRLWSTSDALIQIDPATLKANVKIDPIAGKLETSVDRIAEGKPTNSSIDFSEFTKLKDALEIPPTHPCFSLLEQKSAP